MAIEQMTLVPEVQAFTVVPGSSAATIDRNAGGAALPEGGLNNPRLGATAFNSDIAVEPAVSTWARVTGPEVGTLQFALQLADPTVLLRLYVTR
jgi:hypothetical protein